MRLLHQLFGMRWWLALAFAAVAGLTAVAVVAVFSARAEDALRAYAQEFAVGSTVAASESAKRAASPMELRADVTRSAGRRGISLFAFDRSGRLLTAATSETVNWSSVPGGDKALRTALHGGGRYIEDAGGRTGSRFVVGIRIYGGPGFALVGYSRNPELHGQIGVVRREFIQSALLAFAVGAALGLLIARAIARRLARIAGAANAIGGGDFSVEVADRFPDEVGSLAMSIERMRAQLQELFHRVESERDRLESLLDRLNEGVLLVDRDLTIEFANDRARDLLGVADSLEDTDRFDEASRQLVLHFALDLFMARLPGKLRLEDREQTLLLEGIPPRAGGDTAIVVVVDETERERNERIQREFATNAAHELRTPLASIVTAVEMLRTGAKDEPRARDEFLDVIAQESDRLTRLTRALLVLARAEAREEAPRLVTVPVAPLLQRIATSIPPREGVEVGVDCPPSLAAQSDADLLEQALTSLAMNAANHTSAGSISLRGRRENGSVVIEVVDTGGGILARDRGRIFDRFYRGESRDDGFGLGLAIAREAVHALGGEIQLDSELSVGTTVRVTLIPAAVEEES